MKTKPFLGLSILATRLKPGQRVSLNTMAKWCCAAGEQISSERLRQIEERALRKIRIYVTRELNSDSKEVLLDGITLLASMQHTIWDRTVSRLHR